MEDCTKKAVIVAASSVVLGVALFALVKKIKKCKKKDLPVSFI